MVKNYIRFLISSIPILLLISTTNISAQHSVARQWNDVFLESIREDYARPTVHARNLFHFSVVMYDAWAALNPDKGETYLLGRTVNGFDCEYIGIVIPANPKSAQEEAISYAVYRLIQHRFLLAPNVASIFTRANDLMLDLGYDISITTTDYSTNSYAAFGNYIAKCIIDYGLQDGSNEQGEYGNLYYEPINPSLFPNDLGNEDIIDPNHWQPLTLDSFVDQSGNVIPINTPDFLSPEWGNVYGFSLQESDKTIFNNQGDIYNFYHDPGHPPYIDDPALREEYIWNFMLVSVWGSHLDPTDGVMWDISPASIGNNSAFPTTIEGLRDFYQLLDGGDLSAGWDMNPVTGQPYETQMVPRGDYGRVLAEFWADGPDSETPPGHWFTILNYVSDHPLVEKKIRGEGEVLDDLEWDVKSYFIMGGTMHDVAVTSWGIKGRYDYIRPISAIRYMADQGQSTDTSLANYSERGLPIIEGLIEVVESGDSLEGDSAQHVGKMKVYSWKGPIYIDDPEVDFAGVDWILAGHWWPYQRPSFVTPPFAGYVSGHSTYSRAAAEVMTMLTGDAYFPGGMGEFEAPQNEFLVFEEGPSIDITLQWATYRDASDQCSLSRIWGGIHPPADDIPGRLIGEIIGVEAFQFAETYFDKRTFVLNTEVKPLEVYPNPLRAGDILSIKLPHRAEGLTLDIINTTGELIQQLKVTNSDAVQLPSNDMIPGLYIVKLSGNGSAIYQTSIIVQ